LKPILKARQKILNLPKGVFFFTCLNDFVKFPKFNASKPEEFKPTMPKQKLIMRVLKNLRVIHYR